MLPYKHRAIAGEPFTLELIAENINPYATFEKVEIRNRIGDVLQTITQYPQYDSIKKMFYIQPVVIENNDVYFDYWYFRNVNKLVTIKSSFIVRNKILPNDSFYTYAVISRLKYDPNSGIITIYVSANNPYLQLQDIKIRSLDTNSNIDYIFYHEIGPDIYYVKLKKNQIENIKGLLTAELYFVDHKNIPINVMGTISLL